MATQLKISKPKFKVIQGGNEREMRLIRALDKAIGFKDNLEADAAFYRAVDVYDAEGEAARACLRLVLKKEPDE